MAGKFARTTSVTPEKSRNEIERCLTKYGANEFAYGVEDGRAMIGFGIVCGIGRDRTRIRVRMVLPALARDEYRTDRQYEQVLRSRWRSLALVVKAKLEAIAAGISTIEREFMADILLPAGTTLGESVIAQLPELYAKKGVPRLLAGS